MSDNNESAPGTTGGELSSSAYWMPTTPNRQFRRDPRIITDASGCYYRSADGRDIFDGLSGLWCTGYGHNRPEIRAAVADQLGRLDYAPAFQFSHPGVEMLAERLTQLAPGDLNHAFFTNSGSECADTSLKMARAYWRHRGKSSKTRLIGRSKGYHGVNFGGTSLGGIGANRKFFGELGSADHLPHTLQSSCAFTRGQAPGGENLADSLEDLVALHDASTIAAVIVEPMAGSAGVIVPPIRPYEIGLRCWELGLYVRWGGDTIQFGPPFVAQAEELQRMGSIVADALKTID